MNSFGVQLQVKSFPYTMQQNFAPETGTYVFCKEVTFQTAVQNTTCSSYFEVLWLRQDILITHERWGNLTGINVKLGASHNRKVIFQMG